MLFPRAGAKYRPVPSLVPGYGAEICFAKGSQLLCWLQVGEALGFVSLTCAKVVPCKFGLYKCWVL